MNSTLDIKTAIKESIPTVLSYLGIGIAFGIIGKAAGINVILVTLISLIDYGGAAQFVLINMLVNHSPILSIIFSVFLVNSRMILMSMTIAPYFKKYSIWRNIWLGTFLTDESFALGMNKLNYTNNKLNFTWFNAANLVSYATWGIGTLIGALLGDLIPDPEKLGIGFAITAMFIGLLYSQIISDRSIKLKVQIVVIISMLLLVYIGMIFVPQNLVVLITTIIGCFLGVIIKNAFK